MAKKFWMVKTVEENGKYYSWAESFTESDNVKCRIERDRNLIHANVYATKKRACEIVNCWNEHYRENGTFMFDNVW